MKRLLQMFTIGMLFLFVGLSILNAQVATYSPGPLVTLPAGAANGGFAWGDVNGDGNLDAFVPSNNLMINSIASFAADAVATASVTFDANTVGLALADFNGDGKPDLFTTNAGNPSAGLYYNVGGVYTAATGTGALATTPGYGQLFQGIGIGPIDHSNYLSIVTPHTAGVSYSDGLVMPPGLGMVLLKGGASGFTNVGKYATAGNIAIDTSKSFEMWDPRFFDANNDGYLDLLVPSFRHGFRPLSGGPDSAGARKGSILFLNDGTGKFKIPTTASVGRTLYTVDSVSFTGKFTIGHAADDTGLVVDDTVRHFNAIGNQIGDLNNDGNVDIIFTGTEANNWDGLAGQKNTVVIYGKGDGTYTYSWNGVTTVANGVNSAGNQRAMSIGDYNNDGWSDIYISQTFGAQLMFQNNGNGTFTDVTTAAAVTGGGQRAGGFVDFNNDGFLDIYVHTGSTSVLQKNNANSNKWVGFIPVGTGNNKMAIGARFTIWSGANKQIRDIRASGGAAGGGHEIRALFGLGAGNMDSVMVMWPDGTTQKWTRTELAANGGNTVESKYWTVQYGAVIPPAPPTVSPKLVKADTSLASTVTMKWNKVTGGTGSISYQAQVATASTFASVLKNATGLTDTTRSERLGLSTTYYWRVRATSAGFTGPWSAVDTFKTLFVKDTIVPTQLRPLSGSLTEPARPTLVVKYVAEASTYHLQVAGSDTAFVKNGAFVLNDSVNVLDTTYKFASNLTPGKKYYWRVRGWNAAGSSAWSPVDSFTIMYLPVAPVLASPLTNQPDVVPASVTFKWRKVAGDSNYVLKFWTNLSNQVEMFTDTTKHDTSFTVTNLRHRFRYYWQVMALNQGGVGPFSALDSFSTSIEKPVQPLTVSPKSITGVNMRALFTWRSVPTAIKYHLQVATSNFPTPNIVYDAVTLDTVHLINDTLAALTTHYWHVSAINVGYEGDYSGSAFFTTNNVVGNIPLESVVPEVFALKQNYPNPFNPTTTISYDLPKDAFVNVAIYDILGREVATLVNGQQSASVQHIQWNASGLSSGMYIYRMHAKSVDGSAEFSAIKKLLLMK